MLDRRWLHYAFIARRAGLAMIANFSELGAAGSVDPQRMNIVLVHDETIGWRSSQFNALVPAVPWSSFRHPATADPLELAARSGTPALALSLIRTSRPCTSQCAAFSDWQHLRWQSESGVIADGDWIVERSLTYRSVRALGYHERVRGQWGWPELGGWVFGFANDDELTFTDGSSEPPPWAVVFTLIQPSGRGDQASSSVMLWRRGRLIRHFPRRMVSAAVLGMMDRDLVCCVPPLARTFGTRPAPPIPRRLVFTARLGTDHIMLDVTGRTAARIVNPSETSFQPFSVHEVLGDCVVEGTCSGQPFAFATQAIVEFAGGAADG